MLGFVPTERYLWSKILCRLQKSFRRYKLRSPVCTNKFLSNACKKITYIIMTAALWLKLEWRDLTFNCGYMCNVCLMLTLFKYSAEFCFFNFQEEKGRLCDCVRNLNYKNETFIVKVKHSETVTVLVLLVLLTVKLD